MMIDSWIKIQSPPYEKPRLHHNKQSHDSMESNTSFYKSYPNVNFDDDASNQVHKTLSKEPLEKAAVQAKKNIPLKSFPEKLHEMLQDSECNTRSQSIVSWQPHGRAFRVHKVKKFVEDILPKYFNHLQFTSFQRQLNMYCFRRLTLGADKGSYYHESFLRGQPFRWREMQRIRVKGNKTRAKTDFESEPNFYTLPPSILSQSRNLNTEFSYSEELIAEDNLYLQKVLPGPFAMPSLPLKYLEMSLAQERNIRFYLSNSQLSSVEKFDLPPSFASVGGRTIQEVCKFCLFFVLFLYKLFF
mmetsp:Transcript_27725/g.39667  ORF Transcript_27725/g.39667 Transcript_27725/m.39667 type:complete len:300 (-) Transcript_27725:598-1497(-)